MMMNSPTLEETFAGALGRWRVVDTACDPDRPASMRFAVMARPVGPPDVPEFELCAVQYRPHAEAIAALPELALAVFAGLEFIEADERRRDVCHSAGTYARDAIAKAEGRS